MPLYFFHVYDEGTDLDVEGVDLSDAEEAYRQAINSARALAADDVLKGRLRLQSRIDVADEAGQVVHSVWFGNAVNVEG